MNYGIQLYGVRDIAEKDLSGAIEKVAKLGYASVEFAGFFGHTADEVNDMLRKNNITVSGTHSGLDDLLNNYDETVAFHKAIGNKRYIIPWASLSSQEKIDDFIAKSEEKCKKIVPQEILRN